MFWMILGHADVACSSFFRSYSQTAGWPSSAYFVVDSMTALGQTSALDLGSVDLEWSCSPPAFLEKVVIRGRTGKTVASESL